MRNDARPIGEKLRDIDEHAKRESGGSIYRPPMGNDQRSFVTGRDTGDEETKPKDATVRTK